MTESNMISNSNCAVKVIIIGAGARGKGYAKYALEYPDEMKIVGVAEPRKFYREQMVELYNIPSENIFTNWKDLVQVKKFADVVIIATPDKMHTEPAIACAKKGYHILLEKPMAPTKEECIRIVDAVKRYGVFCVVCHVMRYTSYTKKLKEIINDGIIGEIISIQHLEPVGFWHYAHSYVRGNWRNEKQSSFMLLAKSCHDIDWIQYILGEKCVAVSSFGTLTHFIKENMPENAANRCINCNIEHNCPYSALKIYQGRYRWPTSVITSNLSSSGIIEAIKTGPYGRCVYACDNDVVDHQVVNMEFVSGKTASFTMTAFTQMGNRRTTIFGTKGEIVTDGETIRIYDFLTNQTKVIIIPEIGGSALSGHGGGDYYLMKSFISGIRNSSFRDLSSIDKTLESHLTVFGAEESRLTKTVVKL